MSERIRVWISHFPDRAALQLQWTCPLTGKRKTRSARTSDEREAEAKRVDLEAALNDGRHAEPSRLTWPAFRALFESEYPFGSPASLATYRRALNHLERLCSPRTLAGVNERVVSAYLAGLRKLGLAPVTIRLYLTLLRSCLRWAAGQRLIPAVPHSESVAVPRRLPKPCPAELVDRLLTVAPDLVWRAYLLCGWLAGLRLSEALALRWEEAEAPWLDLARDRIVFPAPIVKARVDQHVPLDAELRAALLALPRRGPLVFPGLGSFRAASAKVVRMARRAGVRLTYHALRRGYCSYYAARVPAAVLVSLTRNSLKVCLAYYCDLGDAAAEAVRARSSEESTRVG